MLETVPQLLTIGKLAEELGVPIERVRYILATRPHIKPIARAGLTRLYNRNGLEAIRRELQAIAERGGAR